MEFRSAASLSAVCGYCSSTLVRDGEALQRIGKSAELFDDHSPLQLGASGRFQGLAFTLVGRLQVGYAEGNWNEWHALFDNGRSGWLSEDNGAYVFGFEQPREGAPDLAELRVGQRAGLAGRAWDVTSVLRARLIAAEGELPFAPRLQGEYAVVELRNGAGEVASLEDSGSDGVHLSVGRSVLLADLALSGLKEVSERTIDSRHLECPNCGAGLDVKLASTQAIVCGSCASVVDVSNKAVGSVLPYYQQAEQHRGSAEPTLALGSSASLALGPKGALPWTVVGMVERCDLPTGGEDEQTFWREYLVYNQSEGFAFIVDAEDGWSWVRPITGAPGLRGTVAQWQGERYQQKWEYSAKVTYVIGEFYWKLAEGETAQVTDYHGLIQPRLRLSRERTASELTWSAGQTLDAAVLAKAFGLPATRFGGGGDAAPLSTQMQQLGSMWQAASSKAVWIFVAIFVLLWVLESCGDNECDNVRASFGEASAEYRECQRTSSGSRVGSGSRGGSWGGYSSGGGHK